MAEVHLVDLQLFVLCPALPPAAVMSGGVMWRRGRRLLSTAAPRPCLCRACAV